MEKCRICLGDKRNLVSIYESEITSPSYANMITSIANVKISKDEKVTNKICRVCRRKLIEAYDFKTLIERSDFTLSESTNLKKIIFNNLSDIKIKIEIEPDNKLFIPKCEDMNDYFKDGATEISYSNTVIKRLDNERTCLKPVPVLEFLKTIKGEDDDDDFHFSDNYDGEYNYGPQSGSDTDYIPPHKLLKNGSNVNKKYKKKVIKQKVKRQTKDNSTNVRIKPVHRKDLKLVYSYTSKPKQKKQGKNYPKTQMCPHCGKMTRSLKSHILQHSDERKFKCDECSKAYFTRSALNNHMNKHSKTKTFKCDQCVAAFIDRCGLRSHMLSHSLVKKFLCNICSKAFKRKCALTRHALVHNSANKNVMCEQCNMSFFSKYGLQHHMRVHTGERPYNCEICTQPYSYKHDFNRHCFKKHGVFLKRRSVYVMNEEVLKQEQILMRDLMLRVHGVIKDGEPLNPFEGPQAAQAFEQAVKALESKQISIDFPLL